MTAINTSELREFLVSGGYRLDTNEGIDRTVVALQALIAREQLKARLVELDLLEQKINREYQNDHREISIGTMDRYKLDRLKDLEYRLLNISIPQAEGSEK